MFNTGGIAMLIAFAVKAFLFVMWASLSMAFLYLAVAAPFVITAWLAVKVTERIKKWLR